MVLTNPYDATTTRGNHPVKIKHNRETHHAPINRKNAVELCKYSAQAYDPEQEQEGGATYIEHSVFLSNDIQCIIYNTDKKKVVAFRGTQETTDWITDLNTLSVKLSTVFPFITDEDDLFAHRGFTTSLQPIYDRIKQAIAGERFDITGHSYGGALATVFGYVYAVDTGNQPEHFYTFGSPRVFLKNDKYPLSRFDVLLEMVRIQNDNDVISYYPQKGGYEAVAKHGGAGAVIGSAIGSIGGGLVGGAIMGAVAGGGVAVASGGYVHVGSGLVLFEDVDTVVYTGAGAEKLLKGRNYYLMPEGVDLMRDPLDIQSTLTQKIIGTAGVEEAFAMVRRLYSNFAGFGDFLSEGRRDGVIARAKNIYDAVFRRKLSGEIVARIAKSRTNEDVIQRYNYIYNANRLSRDAGLVWANPSRYLSGELLERMGYLDDEMKRATESWLGRVSYTDAGFSSPVSSGDLDVFQRVITQEVGKLMNEQLGLDTAVARKFYTMLGASMVVESALVGYAGFDLYTKTVGHKLTNYNRRLMDLPDTIYEGFTRQDVLYSADETFKQVGDNVYLSNGQYYYLSHHANQTTLRPMMNQILGYILYSPEEEAAHVNKLVCF